MNDENISKLIQIKEKELKKIQSEIEMLKNKQNTTLTIDEKIKIFTNYFKGRNDVYPYLSIDKNNPDIKYYIPACANEWKKGICNKTMHK